MARACLKAPYQGAHTTRWHGADVPMAWVLCAAHGKGSVVGAMAWGSQQIAPGRCGMEPPMAWSIQKAHGKGRSATPCRISGREQIGTGIPKFFKNFQQAQGSTSDPTYDDPDVGPQVKVCRQGIGVVEGVEGLYSPNGAHQSHFRSPYTIPLLSRKYKL